MRTDKVISEARARIIWGEATPSVRGFLVSSGIEGTVADTKLEEFNLERNRELRRIGLRSFLIGAVVTGIAGIPICIAFHLHTFNRALAVVMLGVLYGVWKIAIGTIYLVCPQLVHKSIPDIGEYDILE
jgi:hypothetical protein